MDRISFKLNPAHPFRLDLTAWALRRRSDNIIDGWDGNVYSRALLVGDAPVGVKAVQTGTPGKPALNISAEGPGVAKAKPAVVAALEKLLGIRKDLFAFYNIAGQDERLGPLARRFYGLKPPRFPSVFEALANAVSCQQLSLTVGIKLLNRLTMACGKAVHDTEMPLRAFPRPEDILMLGSDELLKMGYSRQKSSYMMGIAREIAEGRLDLEGMDGMDDDAALERLLSIKGVGRWSAEYVLLRGLGRLNVYPGDDVGARNKLKSWLDLDEQPDYDGIKRLLSPWAPYQGFIYIHLLLDGLEKNGYLKAGPQ